MNDKMEYAAPIPGKQGERRKSWFEHIKELQRKNLKRRIAAEKAGKRSDPAKQKKMAKLQAILDRLEKE